MDGLAQQASTLGKFPEDVREIIHVAVKPNPRGEWQSNIPWPLLWDWSPG